MERSRLDGLTTWVAVCGPAAAAVWRASGSVQWRADIPAVRDLGLASVGAGGALSTVLAQGFSFLPLGNLTFRAALGAGLAAGVAALFIKRVAARLLSVTPVSPSLSTLLATVAALMATLSPTWQQEATVGGGAAVAAALIWWVVDLTLAQCSPEARRLTPEATRRWWTIAAVVGLTACESLPAAAAAVVAAAATAVAADERPPWRCWPVMAVVALAVAILGVAPALLRPLASRGLPDVGGALSSGSLEGLAVASERDAAIVSWVGEVGVVALALAGVGLVVGVLREGRRAWTTPLVVLVVIDLVYPMQGAFAAVAPLAPLRLGALAALAVASGVGVAESVAFLGRLGVPMARVASVLSVVFHVTLVGLTCEEAAFTADRSKHYAAEEWTDVALLQLPRDAAVLVHSPALTWRLWAAQTLHAKRPDVLVIPAPLLQRGEVLRHLVPSEPAVEQLLQDFALQGRASEYGLSVLADERPLMVELDPGWDKREVDHLRVEGAWLEFAPQRLGESDREHEAERHALALKGRVGRHLRGLVVPDRTSAAVVARTLKEHATAMSLVGLGAQTPPLIDGVERLVPDDPFVTGARLRLSHARRLRRTAGSLELRDLLKFGALRGAMVARR